MSEEKNTIVFLLDKVKQLELDVQYQLHRADRAEQKYIKLYNVIDQVVKKLNISMNSEESDPLQIV
jgi:hypothetical protein